MSSADAARKGHPGTGGALRRWAGAEQLARRAEAIDISTSHIGFSFAKCDEGVSQPGRESRLPRRRRGDQFDLREVSGSKIAPEPRSTTSGAAVSRGDLSV